MAFLYRLAAHWMGASSCIITLSAKLILFDQHDIIARYLLVTSARRDQGRDQGSNFKPRV